MRFKTRVSLLVTGFWAQAVPVAVLVIGGDVLFEPVEATRCADARKVVSIDDEPDLLLFVVEKARRRDAPFKSQQAKSRGVLIVPAVGRSPGSIHVPQQPPT